jgi:hypothetical protein|tara:strand:+ start:417 stop:635 length:219 start_codon:yes stop_codon:yes gene_type:complete
MSKLNYMIYYTGIGSYNKKNFTEKEFRNIIKNNIRYFHLYGIGSELNEAVNNPLKCNISLLLELTGAKFLKK